MKIMEMEKIIINTMGKNCLFYQRKQFNYRLRNIWNGTTKMYFLDSKK